MAQAYGLDTFINQEAIDFSLQNHQGKRFNLSGLMGEVGMLLGFCGDIWDLASVRHVLWLQRQSTKLASRGINSAIIVPNYPHDLNGFYISIPRDILFPLLADPSQKVYDSFGIDDSGFVFIDANGLIRKRWMLVEGAVPQIRDILMSAQD